MSHNGSKMGWNWHKMFFILPLLLLILFLADIIINPTKLAMDWSVGGADLVLFWFVPLYHLSRSKRTCDVMSCEVYLGDVLCLFQIWMSVSVRDKDIECILKQGNKKKKWGRERSGVGGLSQLLFCCVSSDSGLGCTPSSLGKRFKTQLPPTPFYEKRRWKYAKQHFSTNISYFILVLVEFFFFFFLEYFE